MNKYWIYYAEDEVCAFTTEEAAEEAMAIDNSTDPENADVRYIEQEEGEEDDQYNVEMADGRCLRLIG